MSKQRGEQLVAVSVRRLARALCRRCRGCDVAAAMRRHPERCAGVRRILAESNGVARYETGKI